MFYTTAPDDCFCLCIRANPRDPQLYEHATPFAHRFISGQFVIPYFGQWNRVHWNVYCMATYWSTSLIEGYVYKGSLGQPTLSSLDVASITVMNRKGLRTVSKNSSANYPFKYSQYRFGLMWTHLWQRSHNIASLLSLTFFWHGIQKNF